MKVLYLRVARGARMESGHARTVVGVLSVFVEVKSKVGGVPPGCGSQTKFYNPIKAACITNMNSQDWTIQ